MRLPVKSGLLVLGGFILLIVTMSLAFYYVSESFYREQLLDDIERRLEAHRIVLEDSFHEEAIEHIRIMEERQGEVNYLLLSSDGTVIDETSGIPAAARTTYESWLGERLPAEEGTAVFAEASHHSIPHVYAVEPVMENGEPVAYLFVDEATSRFEATQNNLVVLTVGMAALSFVLAGMLAALVSYFMTRPLTRLTRAAEKVADGNFEMDVYSSRTDEIGELSRGLQTMAEKLKSYQQSRRMLLSNVSHDLRTPLTYVKAYAALLKDNPGLPPDELIEQAGVIHREALRMERLVEDLFQLTKMDEGRLRLELHEENISGLLNVIVSSYEMMAREEGCRFKAFIPDSETMLQLDEARLEQALTNIVRNAFRHTPDGSCVTLEMKETEEEVRISIADEGPGIPEKDISLIWERFYRSDASRTSKTGGSGLGLPIARQIIEAHGGTVEAGNRNSGAEFVFIFPKSLDQ
ncbi:MAG: sensor histidine kinase [Alkalicoccus sp.]|nr:MAG: sensor histidine kinase [Alkalicoccus sp.]